MRRLRDRRAAYSKDFHQADKHKGVFKMATTIKGLKTAFKKAERKFSKAIARYKGLLFQLYMPAYPNCRKSNASKSYADVYLACLNSDGSIREYATDLSWTFYRKGRGGKFYVYEKPQSRLSGIAQARIRH